MLIVNIKSISHFTKFDYLRLANYRQALLLLQEYQEDVSPLRATIRDLTQHISDLRKQSRNSNVEITVSVSTKRFGLLTYSARLKGFSEKYQTIKKLRKELYSHLRRLRAADKPLATIRNMGRGVMVSALGGVYLETGTFSKLSQQKRLDAIYQSKTPSGRPGQFVGIELEFISKFDRPALANKLFEASLAQYVTLRDDGSLRGSATHPFTHELCILVEQDQLAVVKEICRVLSEADTSVNTSCGMHVHVDMRNRDVKKAFSNYVSLQETLYRMCPSSRKYGPPDGGRHYCKPIRGRKFRIRDDRYFGINAAAYNKFSTLELRMHAGTLDAEKIINWVNLLVAIADAPAIARSPRSMAGIQRSIGIDKDLSKYIQTRIDKFAPHHAPRVRTSATIVPSTSAPITSATIVPSTTDIPF